MVFDNDFDVVLVDDINDDIAMLYMFLLFAMMTITNVMVHAMSHWDKFFFFSKKYFTY